MNDEQLIATLNNIKNCCEKQEGCAYCPLHYDWDSCIIEDFVDRITGLPSNWSIEEIEEVVKGE